MANERFLEETFEPELIEEIKECGKLVTFKEGDVIIDYGKYIRAMPIVISGTLKVLKQEENGKEVLLYYLGSNESCSMAYSCCLEARKSEIRAVAEEDGELVTIPHEKLDEWMNKYPGWKRYIMRSFNLRFMELLKCIEQITFHKLDDRLIAYLNEKKRLSGSDVIKASHYQIADELATSRVVISRLLKQLENDGRILLYRNEMKLLKGF
jgi:CRP/FNR family transcriptional regulator